MNTTKLREYATLLRRWKAFERGRSEQAVPAALDHLDLAQEIEAAADFICSGVFSSANADEKSSPNAHAVSSNLLMCDPLL
jgi:hypothetical protein